MSKEVNPHALTIVTTGANHGLLFKSGPAATAAYRSIQTRAREYWAFRTAVECASAAAVGKEVGQIKAVDPILEVTDDFGVLCTVDMRELKSFRVADIAKEHDGAGEMKICEVRAAVRFENYVKEDHADIYSLRTRGAGPGQLWTPNRGN